MTRCETQIDILKDEVERHIWTFRWLWLINLGGIVWGLVARNNGMVAIASISALVAIIGVGLTRRGRRVVDRLIIACFPPGPQSELRDRETAD